MLDAPETIKLNAHRIEYLEFTPSDIGLANRIAEWALGHSIDELAAPTRRLLVELYDWVRGEAAREQQAVVDFTFTNSNKTDGIRLKPFGDMLDHHGFYMLLKAHLTWLATHNFSPATIAKRATYVRAFAVWCLERDFLAPRLVSRAILEAFQRRLFAHRQTSGKPLAWSSQHLHLKELRQFFAWLAKQNILSSNPAADIELPKLRRQLPGATLSAEEVERIMQVPNTSSPLGLRDRAMLEVLY